MKGVYIRKAFNISLKTCGENEPFRSVKRKSP